MNAAEQTYQAIMQKYGGIPFTWHARIDDQADGNVSAAGQGQKTAENASESVERLQRMLDQLSWFAAMFCVVKIVLLSGCAGDPLRSVDTAERSGDAGSGAAMLAFPAQSSTIAQASDRLGENRQPIADKSHNRAVSSWVETSGPITPSCGDDCGLTNYNKAREQRQLDERRPQAIPSRTLIKPVNPAGRFRKAA